VRLEDLAALVSTRLSAHRNHEFFPEQSPKLHPGAGFASRQPLFETKKHCFDEDHSILDANDIIADFCEKSVMKMHTGTFMGHMSGLYDHVR
jgi:hypothetical protein